MNQLNPEKHSTPLKFFLATNKTQVKWIAFNSLLYSLGTASAIGISFFLSKLIDAIQLGYTNFKILIILFVAALVGRELFFRLGHTIEITVNARIREKTKKELFIYTSKLSFGYFIDRFAGQISHQISQAADGLERMKDTLTNQFIDDAVLVIISAITLGFVYLPIGIAIMVWAIIFLVFLSPLVKRITAASELFAENSSHTTGTMVDTYTNIATVKVYSRTFDEKRIMDQVDVEYRSQISVGKLEVLTYVYQGISGLILAAIILVLTIHGYAIGVISVGGLVLVGSVGLKILSEIYQVCHNVSGFIRSHAEVSQALKDILVPQTVTDGNQLLEQSWDDVSISYQDISFSYNTHKKVLDHFNLTIPAGQKVGIVGLSGAGKTTVMNLLLRFFDPQTGTITINNIDISSLTQESLRSHISFISQDTSLFHTTIAENISYGSDHVSIDEVKRAAEMAYADEFIQTLPKKYDTIVGERGVKLSGGQRQRIAIARAILKNSPLFLLDEATSALDSDSEAKVQDALKILMEGKTVIAIAHRLSTLQFMDRIIFVDNGKIIEDGTHTELLERNGKYAELWNMQTGGFIAIDQIKVT